MSDLKFVQAQDELMRGNKLRALELYDEIISIQPNAYETLYERGILNYSLSNYMESKRDFSMVNDINRRDHGSEGLYFESFYWEAAAAIKLGKHNEAKVLIKEINEMFPDFEVPEELKKTLKIR